MAPQKSPANAMEIDRLATQLAKDPQSKSFLPLAEEYCKVGMWEEAVSVLEDGLKYYPGFITAMVVLGRAYDQVKQPTKAKAVLEGAIKLSPGTRASRRTSPSCSGPRTARCSGTRRRPSRTAATGRSSRRSRRAFPRS